MIIKKIIIFTLVQSNYVKLKTMMQENAQLTNNAISNEGQLMSEMILQEYEKQTKSYLNDERINEVKIMAFHGVDHLSYLYYTHKVADVLQEVDKNIEINCKYSKMTRDQVIKEKKLTTTEMIGVKKLYELQCMQEMFANRIGIKKEVTPSEVTKAMINSYNQEDK